eukprot:7327939-Pyramimonas_sp.AAC.1
MSRELGHEHHAINRLKFDVEASEMRAARERAFPEIEFPSITEVHVQHTEQPAKRAARKSETRAKGEPGAE